MSFVLRVPDEVDVNVIYQDGSWKVSIKSLVDHNNSSGYVTPLTRKIIASPNGSIHHDMLIENNNQLSVLSIDGCPSDKLEHKNIQQLEDSANTLRRVNSSPAIFAKSNSFADKNEEVREATQAIRLDAQAIRTVGSAIVTTGEIPMVRETITENPNLPDRDSWDEDSDNGKIFTKYLNPSSDDNEVTKVKELIFLKCDLSTVTKYSRYAYDIDSHGNEISVTFIYADKNNEARLITMPFNELANGSVVIGGVNYWVPDEFRDVNHPCYIKSAIMKK